MVNEGFNFVCVVVIEGCCMVFVVIYGYDCMIFLYFMATASTGVILADIVYSYRSYILFDV